MNGKQKISLLLITIGLLGGLTLAVLANRPQKTVENMDFASLPPGITIEQEVLIGAYTREEMIDFAEVIFLGKVLSISPTFYNQDSGEYWYDDGIGIQLHTIELEAIHPIVDTIGLDKQVTVYVFGGSPFGNPTEEGGITIEQAGDSHNLKIGDQVILFASQKELAWREGGKRLLLMSNPALNAFVQRDGRLYDDPWNPERPVSLEEVIDEIAARREVLAVP